MTYDFFFFWSSDKVRCEEVFEKYKKLGGKNDLYLMIGIAYYFGKYSMDK